MKSFMCLEVNNLNCYKSFKGKSLRLKIISNIKLYALIININA